MGTTVITQGPRERFKYYLYLRQNGLWTREVSRHDPVRERESLLRFCPAHNLSQGYPPTLLLHGDLDTDVPYRQSADMAERLKAHGIESRLITLHGKGHVFDRDMRDAQTVGAFSEVIGFLKQHLHK